MLHKTGVAMLFLSYVATMAPLTSSESDFGKSDVRVEKQVVLSIRAESVLIRKSRPFFVTLTLENQTDKEFDLTDKPTLRLERAGQSENEKQTLGSNFWSWISFLSNLPADSPVRRRGTLLGGEKISIRLNLSELKWGKSILSGYPSKTVFRSIPSGRYELFLECNITREIMVRKAKSNILSVRVH